MFNLLSVSLIVKIAAEISFTEYVGVYDFFNMFGHILVFISFLLLYKAVLETGLMRPYHFLFLDLRRSQEKYNIAQMELRKKIEEQLVDSYKYLGTINRKISLLLDIEERSHKVINKKEIASYIVVSAISASRAEMGLLCKFNDRDNMRLIAGKGLNEEEMNNFQNFCLAKTEFFNKIKRESLKINGPFNPFNDICSMIGKKLTYFVALPIKKEKKCIGLLFLGFTDRKSMDTQELEFLDIFAMHASSAILRAEIMN